MTQIDDIRLILNAIAADIPGFIQTGIPENVKSQNVRSLHDRDNQAAQQMLDLLEQLHESSQLLQGDEDPNEEPPSEFFRAGYFYLQWETTEFSRIPIAFYVCTGVPELGWWKFPSLSALPITHYGVGADPNEGLGLATIPNLGDYYVQTDDGTAGGEVLSVWFYTGVQAGDKWVKIVKGEGGDSGDTPTLQEVWDEDSNVETPDGSSIVIKDTAGARDNIVPFTIIGGDVESTFFKDDGNFVDSFCSKYGLWALGSFNPTSLNNNNVANHAYGYAVLYSLITGSRNTGIGSNALFSITSGHENVAVGSNAGSGFNSGGTKVQNGNTWLGTECGVEAQEVNSTTVIGFRAAFKFRNGSHNIMIGAGSAGNFRDGSGNTIIGRVGFPANTDIDNNVILATGEAGNLTGVVFRVFEDGTTVIPKQTKELYAEEATGKAVVTKEILEDVLASRRKVFDFGKTPVVWTSDGSQTIELSKPISADDWANKIKATITWEDPFEGYKEFGHLANVEGGYLRCAVFIRGNTGNLDITLFLHDNPLGGQHPFTIPAGAKLILEF